MTLMLLHYPLLIILVLLCTLCCGLSAHWGGKLLFFLSVLLIGALLLGALVCMLPYTEILLLLILPLVSVFFASRKEDRS